VARGADLLVTHPVTFAGPLVAERLGLRWASVVLAPMSFFSAQDLPVFPGMGWAVPLRRLGPWAARGLLWIARAVTRPWLRPVVGFRRELGLADRGDPLYEGQFSPSLTLALFSRVMGEPQKDWPRGVRVTGFVPYTGGVQMPSELDDFLGSGEPPIVFTLGSSAVGAAGSFYAESARAAAALGARAVLLAGRSAGDLARSAASSRVFSAEYAPHDELFSRSRAVVHHGGIGTTGQVLRSGRPMLVVPFAHDQPDNAARVARLGVARVVPAQRYDVRSATRRLRELLGGGYGERAARVAAIVRQEEGAARAADELQRLLDDDHL
jgi:rhamnosyltransferase subunit B